MSAEGVDIPEYVNLLFNYVRKLSRQRNNEDRGKHESC